MDTEIIGIKKKAFGIIFTNDLEAVILGCADTDERLINNPANFLAVSDILTFANINTNQWHSFQSWMSILKTRQFLSADCVGSAGDDRHGLLRYLLTSCLHGKSKPRPGAVETSSDVTCPSMLSVP